MTAPLFIVGIGPGAVNGVTIQARQAIAAASTLAGYNLYLDLLPAEWKAGKKLVSSGMRHELERVEEAIGEAKSGICTALICSGDAGIYALASLTLEMLERAGLLETLPWSVIPGVPALCAGAAILGAPISHDFACISLSDLLTPWSVIENRIRHALEGDFVCIFYNPRSRGRAHYLDQALLMARQHRPPNCPIGIVRNASRPEQTSMVTTLANFNTQSVDMLSIVFLGNRETRLADKWMLTPRGYAQKYFNPSR